MSSDLLEVDADEILSSNDQWTKLEETWGSPVDLETEEDLSPSRMKPVFSTLDLRKSTFDSSFLFKKVRRKASRQLSKKSVLGYNEFLQDLQKNAVMEIPAKQFYYINGQIVSALSVEMICDKIDDIFKSVEKLCSATSTMERKKKINEVVQCSISYGDLSFDDTVDTEREKCDSDEVDQYIDEAFEQLNSTIATIANKEGAMDETAKNSVTTLVKKFSAILNGPMIKSPRRRRECSERFKDLAEFWRCRTCEIQENF